jgi:hypothetical protein
LDPEGRKMGFELNMCPTTTTAGSRVWENSELLFISSDNKPLKRGFLKAAGSWAWAG